MINLSDEDIERIAKDVAKRVNEGLKKKEEWSPCWNPQPGS